MQDRQATGALIALNGDRAAFTLLAVIVLLANLLHPLAEARAAGGPNAWIICSTFGEQTDAEGAIVPALADDCPHCIFGSCAGFGISEHALYLSHILPYGDSVVFAGVGSDQLFWLVRGLPAIRAPPVFV